MFTPFRITVAELSAATPGGAAKAADERVELSEEYEVDGAERATAACAAAYAAVAACVARPTRFVAWLLRVVASALARAAHAALVALTCGLYGWPAGGGGGRFASPGGAYAELRDPLEDELSA